MYLGREKLSTPLDEKLKQAAGQWMRRARSNLALAKQAKLDEVVWDDLCFDAQQATEKALKAVLVVHNVDFPKTHEIAELLRLIEQCNIEVHDELWEAHILAKYAVETRYPGPVESISEQEYRQAVALAERVVQWAQKIISAKQR